MATLPQWQPEFYFWLLISCVILTERFIPAPRLSHPLMIWRRLALAMAHKVHKPDHPRSQQRISGLMAALTLLAPWLAIAALLYWMSDLDWLFSALVLFFCLHSHSALRDIRNTQQALALGQKQLARELLQRHLARDTAKLSPLGVHKASIECHSRLLVHGWLATLLWFIIAGPVAALAYRGLYEIALAWPVARRQWRDFGFAANWLMRGFAWPAVAFAWFVLALRHLLSGKILPWRFAAQPFMHSNDGRLWRGIAHRLQISLGGPVLLDGIKQQRPRFAMAAEATATDVSRSLKLGYKLQLACWLILSPLFLIGIVSP